MSANKQTQEELDLEAQLNALQANFEPTYDHPFELALFENSECLADDAFARQVYAALCNCDITSIDSKAPQSYTCSWRYAGGLIAEARNRYFAANPVDSDPEQCLNCQLPQQAHLEKEIDTGYFKFNQQTCPDDPDDRRFVADSRGHEGYMDFYCSGGEGSVSEEVEEVLAAIGYKANPIRE